MFTVIKTGLETSVQDYPGRIGFRDQGFPPSGPMDSWSFRLANRLVNNEVGSAALECQYIGPTLAFTEDAIIAITGADMTPKIDGEAVPMWTSIHIKMGQELSLAFAKKGVRSYIAIAGGIDSEPWLGSQSTFHKAGVGGIEGHSLQKEQQINWRSIDINNILINRKVKDEALPDINSNDTVSINVVYGPNVGWLDKAGKAKFLAEPWKLSGKSDRTGFRLEGPTLSFTDKAINKPPEHGNEPSNIIDQGYPVGGINLAGETPIILVNDGPSMGGFINPFTVPGCEFWKLAQAKPGTQLHFKEITVQQAQQLSKEQTIRCSENNIINDLN